MMVSPRLCLSYARISAPDPELAARFAVDVLGLERVDTSGLDIAFRTDERARSIVFTKADRGGAGIGIEVCEEGDLILVEAALRREGFSCLEASATVLSERDVHRALIAFDGSGNLIELVTRPQVMARRFFPSRNSGVVGLQSIGLASLDIERDVVFWTTALGARVADRVGDITYLALDDLHHRIALHPSNHNGMLYVALEVETIDFLMQNWNRLHTHQIKIVQGPGREASSGGIFLHFAGPTETLFSFGTAMKRFAMERPRPRQFMRTRDALCVWGSECIDIPELAAMNDAVDRDTSRKTR